MSPFPLEDLRRSWRRIVRPPSSGWKPMTAAACLLAAAAVTYGLFIHQVRAINYRVFNIDETVSWAEGAQGIYRLEAKGQLDNMLLSADEWRKLALSFRLLYPRDCGIVFHYIDPEHYHLLYFHQPSRSILWARRDGGDVKALQRLPLPLHPFLTCRMTVGPGEARLTIDGLPEMRVPVSGPSGRFGIMINDAAPPRTVFQDVAVRGTLASGQRVAGQSPPTFKPAPLRYLLAMLPFYLSLAAFTVFLVLVVFPLLNGRPGPLVPQKDGLPVNLRTAGLVHLFLAAAIFSPFFLRGEIFVSSYDNIGEIYPLFFLSKHKFVDMIRTGAWSLWNPYFHDGTPFYSNHWNMIWYPFNWIVFLFPDRLAMTALTFKTFLEVFLIGLLAWGFFSREIPSRFWALVASVSYQLCSFLIFALSIFPTISLVFSMTLFLYLLWSMPERRAVWNYLLLALGVYLIFTSANVVFIFYAALALGVISVYRFTCPGSGGKRAFGTAVAALGTGLLMSAVRVLPSLLAIMDSNRIVTGYYTLHDRVFMAIRLFIPEIAGWFGPDSFNALTSPNLQLIFRGLDMPSNPQNAFFVYFGVFPALLLITSFLLPLKGRPAFWRAYALMALAVGLLIQPFWGILSVLFFPLFHFSYQVIIIPVGVCALIGHAGAFVEHNRLHLKKTGRKLILVLLLAQAYILVFLTYLYPPMTNGTRLAIILVLAVCGAAAVLRETAPRVSRAVLSGAFMLFNALTWALFFFAGTLVLLRPFPRKEGLACWGVLPFLAVVAVTGSALWWSGLRPPANRRRRWGLLWIAAVPVLSGVLLGSSLFPRILFLNEGLRVYVLDLLLAHVRMFVIVPCGLLAVLFLKARRLPRPWVHGLVLFLVAGDLLLFNFRFDSITAPFFHKKAFYGRTFSYQDIDPAVRRRMDLVNYRVHGLHRAGLNANKNVIFGLPSYTGTIGYLSRRFSDFINNFGYPKGTILIYPDDVATNERFLDLSAVRYVLEDEETVDTRPSALARMDLFYDYEVIPDDRDLLARLKAASFDPHRTVLLSERPSAGFTPAAGEAAVMVPLSSAASDTLTARVSSPRPAVLFFDESYDDGWRAYVDGREAPVIRADYNFMACVVPSGDHRIRFSYKPVRFTAALSISAAASLILIFVLGASFLPDTRKKGRHPDSTI